MYTSLVLLEYTLAYIFIQSIAFNNNQPLSTMGKLHTVKFNDAQDLHAYMNLIRKEGCRREKNLVETDHLLMAKLHTHGDEIGRISLNPLISIKYVIQWCYKQENLNA